MENEYKKGNYVLVAGDYNHDVLGNSPEVFDTTKNEKPGRIHFQKINFQQAFTCLMESYLKKIPSARALNEPYKKEPRILL